jgi:5-methylthioadenosine/S-adenosylhomocysteine deaminase
VNAAPKTLLTAAWVAPMDGPILRDAGVVHEAGRVVAVGAARALAKSHPDATVEDLGEVVLLPGLVNAHCHLELTTIDRPPEGLTFVSWVMKLLKTLRREASLEADLYEIANGFSQCLGFGVSSVGDISASVRFVRDAIFRLQGARVVSYGEVRAMASRRIRLEEHLAAAIEPTRVPSNWPRVGISPHAPYSVEPEGYRRCLAAAIRNQLPITTHLAETRDEREFLASHTGPLRELWDFIGGWTDDVPTFAGGPIRYAKHLGLLDYERASLAHVNYCDDDELAILTEGRGKRGLLPANTPLLRAPAAPVARDAREGDQRGGRHG